MSNKKFDVIIIGGGPTGATAGTLLKQENLSVGLFERELYPRFHIGESLLPASMPIFKRTGFYPKLNDGKYIQKCGARFVDYKTDDEVYFGFTDGLNREIPMAFEVERAHFDKDILDHAVSCGVELHQPERVKDVQTFDDHVVVQTNLGTYEASFLIDASGRDAFVGKQKKMRHTNPDLNNVAVFAHYTGVKRNPGRDEGDIIIGLLPEKAWTWIIPFKGEKTSVGIVCSSHVFKGGTDLAEYLSSGLSASPRVRGYMENSERCSEVTVISNYSHTCETLVGKRWILAGDAALFLDPIFSSGVHVGQMSATLAVDTIIKAKGKSINLNDEGMAEAYETRLRTGCKRFHNLISMFYEGTFVQQMKKTLTRDLVRQGFTSAVAGDMWNEENFLFQKGIL